MNQEKINLTIEMPRAGLSAPALRRLSGLVAAHVGLSFEETPTDAGYEMSQCDISPRPALAGLLFDLGERAPDEAQKCAGFIAGLCEQAKQRQTAIYCRSAAADPEETVRQRETLQRFAEERDFGNLVFYEDVGFGWHNASRPDFLRLEEDIRSGKIQRVLSEKLSHLGRNTADVVCWVLWLRQHGAEIYAMDTDDINAALEALENA
jgi:hypothetical protein